MNTIDYLLKILAIPSPSGFTNDMMVYLMQELTSLGYQPTLTNKGGVLVALKGEDESKRRFVTAHVDTLGAIVKAIKTDGRLQMDKIGGYPWNMIEGENCLVHVVSNQSTVSGTILIHQTSTHVYSDAGTAERNKDNMEVRLDAKVSSASETKALGIEVGDFISFDPRSMMTETGFVKSRFLDDKISAAILLAWLREYKTNPVRLPLSVDIYFSNNEEIGYGGNSNIDARVVEYLAIDMGAMGDGQQTDEYTVSICVKDASGPYHFNFRNHLVKLAQQHQIPYRLDIYPYYGSDASAAMRAGADVKHALIGAGVESSHSYERSHFESIQATYALFDQYVQSEAVL